MPKPRAYAMTHALGYVLDVITPEEHERSEGKYTIALYDQAAIDAQQVEIERLRKALTILMRHFPTDSDMIDIGWESGFIEAACQAHDM